MLKQIDSHMIRSCSAFPSTRFFTFAKAISRDVEVSSAKGERPRSLVACISPLATRSENGKLTSAALRRSPVFFEYCHKQRVGRSRTTSPNLPTHLWPGERLFEADRKGSSSAQTWWCLREMLAFTSRRSIRAARSSNVQVGNRRMIWQGGSRCARSVCWR